MLESGGLRATAFADALGEIDSIGIVVKLESRERVHGGTSSTWSGRCAPLDEIDFERRPGIPRSGWPIRHETLHPYYAAAAEHFGFAAPELISPAGWMGYRSATAPGPAFAGLASKVFLSPPEPQHFGSDHVHIFLSERVDLLLDATVVRLEGDSRTGAAEGAFVRSAMGA